MASSERLFGTDGIRGPFGQPPLDRRTVTQLGSLLAEKMKRDTGRAAHVVVGGDTRASSDELAAWLLAGFRQAGGSGRYAGVIPTPGVAYLARQSDADGGIAISASHNPAPDNGIKLFDDSGFKWSRAAEGELEEALAVSTDAELPDPASPPGVDGSLGHRYFDHLVSTLPPGQPLRGLEVALDAANGAATPFAERLFRQLGAETVATGVSPNGRNINLDRGSTQPRHLIDLVRERGSMLGIAFDGDADRALLVDETGALQDGDTMLYLWALGLARAERLEPRSIVATTMSNLGLEMALCAEDIHMIRCDVGDRVVVETMRRHGVVLGGEQSGHLIHLGLGSTGDGLLTALQLAFLIVSDGRPLSTLASSLTRLPQVLVNVRVPHKPDFERLPRVISKAREIEDLLGSEGRLLLRYSGTEPLARVMIEGRDQAEIERLARALADEISDSLGASR